MKLVRKIWPLVLVLLCALCGCDELVTATTITIMNGDSQNVVIGEDLQLETRLSSTINELITWYTSNNCIIVDEDGLVTGVSEGTCVVTASINGASDTIIISVIQKNIVDDPTITLSGSKKELKIGDELELSAVVTPLSESMEVEYFITEGTNLASLNDNILHALAVGTVKVIAKIGNVSSNEISISILNNIVYPTSILISCAKDELSIGEEENISLVVTPSNAINNISYEIISGMGVIELEENKIVALSQGTAKLVGKIGNIKSNTLTITVTEDTSDPYENMTSTEFYKNYHVATSYLDAYYRTIHGFMSGSIAPQDQEPTISVNQPTQNGLYLRNSGTGYSSDGNTYYIVDYKGQVVNKVYKGGAYVTLEEVAAYVLAFGDVPANYVEKKSANPEKSIWGEYLRLNHSYYSGDVDSYPYEPVLPNIRGCGGELYYYEIDLGTTGTDCDPDYDVEVYNDGENITRGAARIVYTRYDKNENEIIDINEKYVFYTYNHYNDFQEYLNYQGGWGEMFGNITGGGSISSRTDYNPTSYVNVVLQDFTKNLNLSSGSIYETIDELLCYRMIGLNAIYC